VKERKGFLSSLFDRYSARQKQRTPEETVMEHHGTVSRAMKAELGSLLAGALFAKKTLDTTRQVDMPFPDVYVLGEMPVDAAGQAQLAIYAAQLEKFQSACVEHNTPVTLAVARGLTSWIALLYSAAIPGMLPHGQEIWARLLEAEDALEEGYRFLLRREPTDVERTYFSYRPALFAPPKA
jgi:hypothetical protein